MQNTKNQQSNIQIYEHDEFGSLQVLMIDGKPYFPATECAKTLGYTNPKAAIIRHCRGVTKRDLPSTSGMQSYNFIPEGDLYRLIIRSKLPAAVRFEAWVCDIVLPTIRAHGAYITNDVLERMEQDKEYINDLILRLTLANKEKEYLEKYAETTAGKMDYLTRVIEAPAAIAISVIAEDYGMTAYQFNRLLEDLGFQYKRNGVWLLCSEYKGNGYTVLKTKLRDDKVVWMHTYWTQAGRMWLYEMLKAFGYIPKRKFWEGVA